MVFIEGGLITKVEHHLQATIAWPKAGIAASTAVDKNVLVSAKNKGEINFMLLSRFNSYSLMIALFNWPVT